MAEAADVFDELFGPKSPALALKFGLLMHYTPPKYVLESVPVIDRYGRICHDIFRRGHRHNLNHPVVVFRFVFRPLQAREEILYR